MFKTVNLIFCFTIFCQWRVRKEAMMGLASIYRKYSLQGEGGREASKQISWIKDKLLHIYYQNSIDDRFVYIDPPPPPTLFILNKKIKSKSIYVLFWGIYWVT